MRKLSYLSPTSLACFFESREDFYLRYLADNRPPRMKQTQPMSVGSAFDAYAKNYLFLKLFGKNDPEYSKYDLENLLPLQIEAHNLAWARAHGKYVFEQYVQSGAASDCLTQLTNSLLKPRFELEVSGAIEFNGDSVPFLGKPDVFYVTKQGLSIISDWKVNGYCSKNAISPKPGYIKILPNFQCHGSALPITHKGTTINGNKNMQLDHIDVSWARQTVIYAWLCGCPVGSEFVHAIDQVVCNNRKNPNPGIGHPEIRFAQHRYLSNVSFQEKTFNEALYVWNCSKSQETFFDNMSPEESKSRCLILEKRNVGTGDELFDSLTLD